MNDDPITPLIETAARLHEVFTSFLSAGFTEGQALYLVAKVIETGAGRDDGNDA